jgi:GNAT superfamily N-acetyltransferase
MKRPAAPSNVCTTMWAAAVACTAPAAVRALSSAAAVAFGRGGHPYDVTLPSVEFSHAPAQPVRRHQQRHQDGSTSSSSSSPSSSFPWEFRSAQDFDVPVMTDLLEQKCQFDRDLSGRPPVTMKPATGDTLTSLFPELPTGQVLLIHEKKASLSSSSSGVDVFADDGGASRPVVGFAMYALRYYGLDRSVPPSMWLHALFVEPNQRSNGAGKALMDEIADISRTKRCSHVGWKCHVDNFKGQKFYDRMGASIDSQKGDLVSYSWVPDAWGAAAATTTTSATTQVGTSLSSIL